MQGRKPYVASKRGAGHEKTSLENHTHALQIEWAATITEDAWRVYRDAIRAVRNADVPFLLGGGFALAGYTGRWRDTKDIDFYVLPQHRQIIIEALDQSGLGDLHSQKPYDRNWIYRSTRDDFIVDIIWSMANQRAQVDGMWFERASRMTLRGEEILVVPREEFMWCKLYIMQRDHCDWTDLLNLLYAAGSDVDWNHLILRLGPDLPLLRALLTVYGWLCPRAASELPAALWSRLQAAPPPADAPEPEHDRIRLLDSRRWFAANSNPGEKLEV